MSSRAFEDPEVNELSLCAQAARSSAPVTASLVCRAAATLQSGVDFCYQPESSHEDGSCIVGIAWAVALEAAAVFGIHGICNFCHLLH